MRTATATTATDAGSGAARVGAAPFPGEVDMRLLIIEDEKPLANVLKKGFEENAFTVDLAFDGEDG